MPTLTIQQAFDLARQHHQAGRLREAESLYRQIISFQPGHGEALHMLGLLAYQTGRGTEAIELIQRAIATNPQNAVPYGNLGVVLATSGRLHEAIAAYSTAIALEPNDPGTLNNLGSALQQTGRVDQAIASFRRALALHPNHAEAHYNLATALRTTGSLADAIAEYRQATALRPDFAAAFNDLAAALLEQNNPDEAILACNHALSLQPDSPETRYNLGSAFKDQGLLDEAIAEYRKALELRPDFPQALVNLGSCLKDTARLDDALACYRQAETLRPDGRALDNLLYTLCFHPDYNPKRTFEEHVRWNEKYARPLAGSIAPHPNDRSARSAESRLRIGYVSPDFRDHPIGRFLLPVLANHDHRAFEIFCYSDVRRADYATERSRSDADAWRDAAGMSDEKLASQIREDRIDILVDLALHMADNRLRVFARKPAPVQVTWLGYPGTTGLETMDYRLTDPYMEPPGDDDQFYSEKTIRLPDSFWCFDPITHEPPVNELPALKNGFITFGCLNNFCKVTAQTLQMWGAILSAVPGSRLLILAPPGSARQWVSGQLGEMGVDPERLEFTSRRPRPKYLELHHGIDVSLDTFPCNGHTTAFDSLWMGVPVVTRPWLTPVSRGGVSILTNLGLTDLIAHSVEQYAQLATELAFDLPRLVELRASLRTRMLASPLMDAPRFTRNLEAAYRKMWTLT